MKEAIASESYGAVPSDEPSAVRGESAAGAVAATQMVPGEGGTSGGPAVQYKSELEHFVREISISPARAGAPLAGAVPGLQVPRRNHHHHHIFHLHLTASTSLGYRPWLTSL